MTTPITLTPAAARRLARIQQDAGAQAVRIALKRGGCAGMEYSISPLGDVLPGATSVSKDGACLVVDPLAEMFLIGTEIDYTEGLLESGFVFKNPNVTSSCGCGASVSF